ncbi:MAG: RNA polymerase sigma factor [Myxococcales bacterium FL481]|nr:MAG: RNA polymerase sigma factor [Myxococcales bacterium FL481]
MSQSISDANPHIDSIAVESSQGHVNEASVARRLFLRYERDVNRLVYRLLGPDRDHDDIVQDAFVRIIGRHHTLRDPAVEKAWVNRVTVSVVRNHLRRRKVRKIVEFWPSLPDAGQPPEGALESRSLLRRSWKLLDRLAANDRTALLLRRVEERPLQEVAELCSCSVATVKRRIARAENKLQRALQDEPDLYRHLSGEGPR